MWIYIIIAFIVVILLYLFILYNVLTKQQNRVEEAFSTMDVYLKKRWDLIPNLVEVVKGYMKHEKTTFEEITRLRGSIYEDMSTKNKITTNEQITTGIHKLMALAESYPELKASENFLKLSDELRQVEDEIANARKYYNAVVRLYNNKVQVFPNNIFSKILGFKRENMFEAKESERESIQVDLNEKSN